MRRKDIKLAALIAITAVMTLSTLAADAASSTPAEKQRALAIQLGAPFCDNAVLQRGMKVPVWGWCKPGTKVTVAFAGQKTSGTAGKDGKWMVWLDPLKASFEPAEMVITETGGKIETLKNILVGEVWMASGQSNMQWQVTKSSCNRLNVDAVAGVNPIREFEVTDCTAQLHPIDKATGAWKDGGYSGYSAIAFAFAHKLYKELNVPIGILNCSWSQTSIQAWVPREGFRDGKDEYTKAIYKRILETDPTTPEHKEAWSAFYKSLEDQIAENEARVRRDEPAKAVGASTPGNTHGNRDASWLFNGRLNPVVPYAIRGAIWNQGYANTGEGLIYYNNLHSLIRGWRIVWDKPELPVYFHQFYCPGSPDKPSIDRGAEMRLGTWMARDIPNAGMASQIDISGAIHYTNKAVPGQRLALQALKNQYGKKVAAEGPMFKSYEVKGDKVIVKFDGAEGGLVVADTAFNRSNAEGATGFADPKIIENGEGQVKLFYLADEDRVWHPATFGIDGDEVIVTSTGLKKPRGVSYGSGGIGFQPCLYNKALLPATPFINYDHELVTSKTWPDAKLKIAGETIDPTTVGNLYEWRKMPILSTQFRDNAVLQADKPLTIWGSTRLFGEWQDKPADGKVVIHFSFAPRPGSGQADTKKTIDVTPEMAEWQVTLPPMKASAEPHSLKVSATLDGQLVHERTISNIVLGEVFYVAGAGGKLNVPKVKPSGQIVRMIGRRCQRSTSPNPSRFSVAVSRTQDNRYASIWENARGLAADLGNAIAAKTGTPVGIIYMSGQDSAELRNWVPHTALAEAPSWKEDYKIIGAKYPGTPYYDANIRRYIGDWKRYWSEYIPAMIATKAVPDNAVWGQMPAMVDAGSSTACQSYNILTHSFFPTTLRGVIFLAGPQTAEAAEGANFGPEMSALANSWKQGFARQKDEDIPFFYTMPGKDVAPKITRPKSIKGKAIALEGDDWSPIEKLIVEEVR